MKEEEIFEHLFTIAPLSTDTDGVVTSCLVREGEILADAVSAGVEHAEYELIKKLGLEDIVVLSDDTLYVTLQPCDLRSSPEGEALGNCTANVIKAGIKNVVYAATYPKSLQSIESFAAAGVNIRQVGDGNIVRRAVELFNSTNESIERHIPLPT
jgi:deoxycytidylate deaminase